MLHNINQLIKKYSSFRFYNTENFHREVTFKNIKTLSVHSRNARILSFDTFQHNKGKHKNLFFYLDLSW